VHGAFRKHRSGVACSFLAGISAGADKMGSPGQDAKPGLVFEGYGGEGKLLRNRKLTRAGPILPRLYPNFSDSRLISLILFNSFQENSAS
jgi:hypothetical protein